ncbi:CocE/NonD family hydrolase C-terminal non-catalytic domain-containing protein [Streptomyces sp. NPDC088554]|uniref:CocE/NonD family hydrolase C-terminal non-catalytic domain-containing protein n=1 Tax=Streptomyces sp. NPDC088554 TaxID=3365865 RepID=UPI0038191731
MTPTAYRFKRGHRIRVQVSSGASPATTAARHRRTQPQQPASTAPSSMPSRAPRTPPPSFRRSGRLLPQ